MKRRMICIVILLVTAIGRSSQNEAPPAVEASTWAVVISGINKDPDELQAKAKAVMDMERFLKNKAKLSPDNLFILTSKSSIAYKSGMMESTLKNIAAILKTLSEKSQPQDTFIFYYVGQANIVHDKLRLNLDGPDLCHDELAGYLNAIRAQRCLIVLDCPAAGLALPLLAKQNRVVIAGAYANQPWSTRLSQYFIPAMSDKRADYDSNDKISVLEAFRYASIKLDEFYQQQNLIKTESPLLEDDGDAIASQQPWTFEQTHKDGLLASEWTLYEY